MDQRQPESSPGEMMVFGLIEQADRMGKSTQETQRALAKQIEELGELGAWAEAAVVELQKRADAAIKNLEAERAQLHSQHTILQTNAMQAIHDAVRKQSVHIERQAGQALESPLRDIQQAAQQVRQNVKETKWLVLAMIFFFGIIMGLVIGYWPLRTSQNNMQEQLNRIEQSLAAQQQPVPTPAAPEPHKQASRAKSK